MEEVDIAPAQVYGTIRDIPVNECVQISATDMTFHVIPSDTNYGIIFCR